MKILPDINTLSVETAADILSVKINEAYEVKYRLLENSEEKIDIVHDLVESKAYATMFLYLNENFNLIVENEKDAQLFFEDCETLLNTNIRIVEEIGKPLTEISGYPIFESDRGILRGAGKKKILESFEERGEIELENIDLEYLKNRKYDATIIGMSKCPSCGNIFDREANTFDEEVEDSIPYSTLDNPYNERKVTYTDTKVKCPYCGDTDNEEDFPFAWVDDLYDAPNAEELVPGINSSDLEEAEEGTQCSDIAPKMDQDLGITKANPDEEKRHFDILLGDYNNSLDESVCFKGFLKNAEGQYQRGNYILVKEGDKYLAIHKDKLLTESKIQFTEKDVKKYLGPVNVVSANSIQQTAKNLSFEPATTGTLMNGNSAILYEIVILRDNGADLIGICDEIKSKLSLQLKNDYKISKITVAPAHAKHTVINIGLFAGDEPIEI